MKASPLLLLLCALPFTGRAAISLPPIFSNHAVLQKAAKVPVWGKADPGEKITLTISGADYRTVADGNGAWRLDLDLSAAPPGPHEVTISGSATPVPVKISDVLVGEVWLAAGQSNMEFRLKGAADAANEIPASANPQLRQFLVSKKASPSPQENAGGSWTVAGPQDAGAFTAVGYYFGKRLQNELRTPVGIVHTSWGGTPIESWMGAGTLASNPELKEGAEKSRKTLEEFPAQAKAYAAAVRDWEERNGRVLSLPDGSAAFTPPSPDEPGWTPVTLPAAEGTLPSGTVWLQKKIALPADIAATRPPLEFGGFSGFDTVYWKELKVGETGVLDGGVDRFRRYYLSNYLSPAYLSGETPLKPAEGLLSIRIASPAASVAVSAPLRWGTLSLEGAWNMKVEKELPAPSPEARASWPAPLAKAPLPANTASYLYNAMLAPLMPYAIRGAIWYQGESNTERAFQYRTTFPLMISEWRKEWGGGDFPFYFCQLANYMAHPTVPGESAWAELREAQAAALSLPRTGMAVLIDAGEENDIHPRDKKIPGDRLAAVALADTYGKAVPSCGPVYASMTVEGNAVRVRFSHADGGLAAHPLPADFAPQSRSPGIRKPLVRNTPQSQLEGFALCGADHVWKWADAGIDGETVVVRSKDVPQPVAVRYAWANDPICNLYNGAGFPAPPFRSDDFPETTAKNRF